MKKILSAIALIISCFTASAQYSVAENNDHLPWGTTNFFFVDATESETIGIDASFTGGAAHTITALIEVTNSAAATNDATISVFLGGEQTVYTWKLTPQTTATNLTIPYTNLVIGITNAENAVEGETITVTLNGNEKVFTWTNTATSATDLQTNATTGGCGTVLYNAFLTAYPLLSVNLLESNTVQVLGGIGDVLIAEQTAADWGTNLLGEIFSVTNVVATNSLQIAYTNSTGKAATNLAVKLAADFPELLVTQPASNQVQLVTLLNPGLTVTQSTGWSTNTVITSNAIAGGVIFKASNSVDRVKWYRAATLDFTIPYSSTTEVSLYTNVTGFGAAGYVGWAVENAGANYAEGAKFRVKASTKKGL